MKTLSHCLVNLTVFDINVYMHTILLRVNYYMNIVPSQNGWLSIITTLKIISYCFAYLNSSRRISEYP